MKVTKNEAFYKVELSEKEVLDLIRISGILQSLKTKVDEVRNAFQGDAYTSYMTIISISNILSRFHEQVYDYDNE